MLGTLARVLWKGGVALGAGSTGVWMAGPSPDDIPGDVGRLDELPYVQKLMAKGYTDLASAAPAVHRRHMFSIAILSGRGRIEEGPLMLREPNGSKLVTVYRVGSQFRGHHRDGMAATILDEGLAACAFQALPNKIGVTATLSINTLGQLPKTSEPQFIALESDLSRADVPLPKSAEGGDKLTQSPAETSSSNSRRRSRKAEAAGTLWLLDSQGDKPKSAIAHGHALMVEPRWGKYIAWLSPIVF